MIFRLVFIGVIFFGGWYAGAKFGAPASVVGLVDNGVSFASDRIAGLMGREPAADDAVDEDSEDDDAVEDGAADDDGSDYDDQVDDADAESSQEDAGDTQVSLPADAECGGASYYADQFNGAQTASGEIYRPSKYTAAHKTLPFGTMVRVTRVDDGRSVDVTVNDRGPFTPGRVIDLSYVAAEEIGLIIDGVTDVCVEVL